MRLNRDLPPDEAWIIERWGTIRPSSSVDLFACPVVVPTHRREFDRICIGLFRIDGWSDQEIGAEEKFIAGVEVHGVLVLRGVRKFEEERSNDGQARTRHLLCRSVEIGQQFVSFFDIAFADRFLLGTMDPDLLVG